jgi:hypothetical protein
MKAAWGGETEVLAVYVKVTISDSSQFKTKRTLTGSAVDSRFKTSGEMVRMLLSIACRSYRRLASPRPWANEVCQAAREAGATALRASESRHPGPSLYSSRFEGYPQLGILSEA